MPSVLRLMISLRTHANQCYESVPCPFFVPRSLITRDESMYMLVNKTVLKVHIKKYIFLCDQGLEINLW